MENKINKSNNLKDTKKTKITKITKDMNLAEVLDIYPNLAEILLDYELHCVGCIAAHFDSIEAGAKVHGLSDEDIDEMVERMNEVVEFGE